VVPSTVEKRTTSPGANLERENPVRHRHDRVEQTSSGPSVALAATAATTAGFGDRGLSPSAT